MRREYWDRELETMPWSSVEAWQADRIADALERIAVTSEFYRDRIPQGAAQSVRAGGIAGLVAIPPTRKDELRTAQEERRDGMPLGRQQAVPMHDIAQIVSSSGTTGHPLYYGLTSTDIDVWADVAATTFFTAGVRPDDIVGHLVGLPMVAGGLPYADGYRRLGATLAWVGGFPTERILQALPRLGVTALLATTSFGVYLTESCEEIVGRSAASLGIRKLQLGGEPGLASPEIRARIKAGWQTDHVREGMGLADVLAAMWSECEEEGGMHFNGQRAVAVELVDPGSGASVAWSEGASGEILYTTFAREATPVVRYRSADRVVVTGIDCACGRTSPRIVVVGRTDDMLIYKGMNVFPTAIRDLVVREFGDLVEPHIRIWKDRPDQVQFLSPIPVEIEARTGSDPASWSKLGEEISHKIREHLQVRVSVSLVLAGTLPRSVHKSALVAVRRAES